MAKREQLTFKVKCPVGCQGTILIEEDENPIYGRRPEFISISDGFRRSPKDDKRNRFGITCTAHRKASSYGVKTRSRV